MSAETQVRLARLLRAMLEASIRCDFDPILDSAELSEMGYGKRPNLQETLVSELERYARSVVAEWEKEHA